jgi:hypothetical protein
MISTFCDVIYNFWRFSRTELFSTFAYLLDNKWLVAQSNAGGAVNICSTMICVQAFVSEYAVWHRDAGKGSLLASLAEAAFLTGLERNRCGLLGFLNLPARVLFCSSSHHDLMVFSDTIYCKLRDSC